MHRPPLLGAADFKVLMAKKSIKPFELSDSELRQAVHAAPPGSLVFVLDHPELRARQPPYCICTCLRDRAHALTQHG